MKPATALALLATGAFLGAALSAVVPAGRAVPAAAMDSGPAAGAAPASPVVPAVPSQDGYAAVARAVMPAVVNISSLKVIRTYEYSPFLVDPFFRDFFGQQFPGLVVPREKREMSLGSGVFVDERGTILTNYHVVEQAQEVKVALSDGRETKARILGADQRTDLAVLRVEKDSLPHAAMGDSEKMEVGDVVLAVGNPFGLGETVTMGIISAIGRGSLGLADYEDFIQTDAAINPGNSGGALVNTRGEVIGINTAIYSRSGGYQGIGFAIPSNMARDVLDSIVKTGRVVRGYTGLAIQGLTPELARAFGLDDARGAVVAGVDPDGPAAEAGLRRGDVIVSFRGRPVVSDNDVRTQLSRLKPGERAVLEIVRDGHRREVTMVLSEPPAEPAQRRRRG
ncbi:MAG TPA: Do family serine endopeptidase [Candidatus Dormibacteraeota bacterium]|nr:Do family serine endopeptidase [Candidatus Dormibacteraeota bacterium]